jgi:hypothetical protein
LQFSVFKFPKQGPDEKLAGCGVSTSLPSSVNV